MTLTDKPIVNTKLVLSGTEKPGLLLSGLAAVVEDDEDLDHCDLL